MAIRASRQGQDVDFAKVTGVSLPLKEVPGNFLYDFITGELYTSLKKTGKQSEEIQIKTNNVTNLFRGS